MSILQNKTALSWNFEVPYFVEILSENINIENLLTEKSNLDGLLQQQDVVLVITWLRNLALVKLTQNHSELNGILISWKSSYFKGCATTFLLVCFVSLKESIVKQGQVFSFHFESSFRSWDNQILTFQISKCYDVIKYLDMNVE